MLTILVRTLIIYLSLIITMRVLGKRQLGELEVSELVTTLLLSEVASLPVTDQDIPLSYALLPIFTLMALEVLLSGLSLRLPGLKRLLSVRPAILIRDGRPDPAALRASRISVEELFSQLRQKDVTDPADVAYAIVEPNGQLSVVLRAAAQPASARDVGARPVERGMTHVIISEGRINEGSLALAGRDRRWLDEQLAARRLAPGDVFLLLADDAGHVRVLTEDEP